jgi:peptidoglycan hydrolase-like protein with peptidoglycan-binding domain
VSWGRLLRHRGITATASAAAMVAIAGGTFIAVSSPRTSHEALASVGNSKPRAQAKTKEIPADPLHVVSVSPGSGAHGVNGAAPIKVTFSSDLAPSTPLPSLSPKIPGSWQVSGRTAAFTPQAGYLPGTTVTVKIPGGRNAGVQGTAGAGNVLAKAKTVSFTTGSFSTLRLQELLTQLGYLPFTWTPSDPASGQIPAGDANAQLAAAYNPPAGSFAFKGSYPTQLTSQWRTGQANILDDGAIRAFESDQGLTMDGQAGPQVWSSLLAAIAKNQVNPHGYTYALASQNSPESLTVWHNGKVLIKTAANTGIPASPTVDGTFPVYLRYQNQVMKGTNPDGSKYADPVSWVSYFNGGDALHYFPRSSFGYYQSLGCVELPWTQAEYIWNYTTYGTLVTVDGPVA